ncbi:TniQ family protein [Deinococcus yunweiensis]|uniref:TniQ family protein n=1 Tax=Deinococcus yunweiensis TaxID=367282 RepID=UPI00398F0749
MTPHRLGARAPVRLPVRPRPEPNELLSSWLFRLAQANTQKLHSLSRTLFGDRQIWNRDIDRLAGPEVLAALEGATGIRATDLRVHTLPSFEGRVYDRHNANGITAWILPLGIYHRTHRRHGLQYCPACLKERPAFLTLWRLSLSVVCPLHGCDLHEACPACGAPVIPFRVDAAAHLSKSLPTYSPHTCCFQCGFALDRAPVTAADPALVAWQRTVHEAIIGSGMMTVRGVGAVPLLEYLSVARLWLTLLTFGRRAERLRELVDVPVKLTTGARGRSLDHLDVQTRRVAVLAFVTLLEGWPERMVDWSRAARIRRSTLLQDMAEPPGWYLDALRPLEYVNPRRALTFTLSDLAALEALAHAGDRRSLILLAYHEGESLRAIARTYGGTTSGIRKTVTLFVAGSPRRIKAGTERPDGDL